MKTLIFFIVRRCNNLFKIIFLTLIYGWLININTFNNLSDFNPELKGLGPFDLILWSKWD